ncbi:uncharacterized protein LOC100216863 isoform 2 [Zea mays]|uniref:Uncharacterized protein n=1 Tax=Zea mays TaxID=4577 RepID=C0P2I2_MAIZE|nr:uncharacterized protein LOC100216863 isoform 2 [Zea mays]ACN27198.1 unknown [Zea mays]|eukprot:NP_001168134.1 uncharacterized protein LOC100216863 isoform 2 [Zea mays]
MWCCVSEENATSNFAAIDASLGDATGEGVAARGLATRGARAASSAVALGFSGEAEKPREEGKLMLSSADEGPGDDDAVEEPTPRTVQLRVRGAAPVTVPILGSGTASSPYRRLCLAPRLRPCSSHPFEC